MATLTVSTLRQRLAEQIGHLQSPSQWRESPYPHGLFPADPGRFAQCAFAVAVLSTEFTAPFEAVRHKRGSAGGLVQSTIGVQWTYRLRADDAVDDLDAATDAEHELLKALTDPDLLTDVHLWVTRLSRRVVGDGTWLLGEVEVMAEHRIAIQPA